ncbi:cyclic nucleotide-binding domain-containing protein [Thermodesulfobacteriota bacterium]
MEDKVSLSGSLKFISLADLFQILGGNKSTGTVKITSQYAPNPGQILFVKGDPVNAFSETKRGVEAIYDLFGWTDGKFEFLEDDVKVPHVIKQGRMEIVLDALRMLDDGMVKKVGPSSFVDTSSSEKSDGLPVLKGPFADYTYILNEEEFHSGEKIVKEGRYGKWIWVVLEGVVEVSREKPGGFMTISRLGTGCFLGTFTSLMFEEYARNATITAVGKVWLGLLDTERLSKEYTPLSLDFRNLLLSIDRRFRKVTDRAVDLSVNPNAASIIPKDRAVVIKKGSPSEELYSIDQGVVDVIGQSSKGGVHLVSLEKDDIFGKVPFMDMGHEPESAAALGSKNLKMRKLDIQSFQRQYEQLSDTFRNFIFHMGNSISVTTRLVYNLHEGNKPKKKIIGRSLRRISNPNS